MKAVMLAVVTLLFLCALGSQSSLFSQSLHPRISYKIRVDARDLSGFDVEMRVHDAGPTVRIAMASHPEYDDRYWRYVENLTAESHGARLQITSEENALWRVVAPGGDLAVKYRIHLPPQTTPTRAAWKPFLSPTGGLVGDLHSLMYVVGATSVPARVILDLPSGWSSASACGIAPRIRLGNCGGVKVSPFTLVIYCCGARSFQSMIQLGWRISSDISRRICSHPDIRGTRPSA